jgi:hypothetical protein
MLSGPIGDVANQLAEAHIWVHFPYAANFSQDVVNSVGIAHALSFLDCQFFLP